MTSSCFVNYLKQFRYAVFYTLCEHTCDTLVEGGGMLTVHLIFFYGHLTDNNTFQFIFE